MEPGTMPALKFALRSDATEDWVALPGADLIRKGLVDLSRGQVSNESLLVEISASRLRALGFEVHSPRRDSPEHELFLRLSAGDPERAHSRYNALLRRLASFHHSARCGR
jgi:hypothetical protein